MKYQLFDFQKDAVNELIKTADLKRKNYESDSILSAISLTAPTGAGKTVISAAVAEGLFFGNEVYPGDSRACILWLSDSPSLNEQTIKRFAAATDLLNASTSMEAIGPEFAKNHNKLIPGHIYFLNRQLLTSSGHLANEKEGGRTFYDVLADTISDLNIHLYLFIDEAHRGLGFNKKDTTSDRDNKTIYEKIIDGQPDKNPPMPVVIGISATPERFENAMKGRRKRKELYHIDVPVSEVRDSGLIKESIELRTPKTAADTKRQDLKQACSRFANASKVWKKYCTDNSIFPIIVPLMVIQVEDKVSVETLNDICNQIHKTLPWLDVSTCFANVFGEHNDIVTSTAKIPYVKPEEVAEKKEIRVLFAKDAISTGWDCPRAEVIYSRRKRSDPTYIAQLIGRMIRTPLARRIDSVEELNIVSCYLPEYDEETVESVVERLKEDNVAIEESHILKNPVKVGWFGKVKAGLNTGRPVVTTCPITHKKTESDNDSKSEKTDGNNDEKKEATEDLENEFRVVDSDSDLNYKEEFAPISVREEKKALKAFPDIDDTFIKEAFESIVTRTVKREKSSLLLDLWNCVDIINSDCKKEIDLSEEFVNEINASVIKHPKEFNRTLSEISNTTVLIKRVNPLTGEAFSLPEELVENDSDRLLAYFDEAKRIFACSDIVNYYVYKYEEDTSCESKEAIKRISAAAKCFEIMADIEKWAEEYTKKLVNAYGSYRASISEANKGIWERIEGNAKPYIERNLNINASKTNHNKDNKKYEKHIICDEEGLAYFKLNPLEDKVLEKELKETLNVAWYRNEPNNLNASFSMPYELTKGEWKNNYPDFIFFQKMSNGSVKPSIVDPHGDWLGDSIAKLKGYVSYLKDHPDTFARVLAVTDEKDCKCRYLDLTNIDVQKAIENFQGNTARELFMGLLGHDYDC